MALPQAASPVGQAEQAPADADLRAVVDAWPALAAPLRAAVLALVKTAEGPGRERGR